MQTLQDDCVKRRLTERADIIMAVDFLKVRGLDEDGIVIQLTRLYYVDIDILNAVLAGDRFGFEAEVAAGHATRRGREGESTGRPSREPLRAVA